MVSWEYNAQGVDRPIDILGVYRPGSISSNALGVDRPNKWEYIGQGVDRLVIHVDRAQWNFIFLKMLH